LKAFGTIIKKSKDTNRLKLEYTTVTSLMTKSKAGESLTAKMVNCILANGSKEKDME